MSDERLPHPTRVNQKYNTQNAVRITDEAESNLIVVGNYPRHRQTR